MAACVKCNQLSSMNEKINYFIKFKVTKKILVVALLISYIIVLHY